jgi:hypothetical protein
VDEKAKLEALTKIINEPSGMMVDVDESSDEEYMDESKDKCRCGMDLKCPSCGMPPSKCECD